MDYRGNFINDVERSLVSKMDRETFDIVSMTVIKILYNYEITGRKEESFSTYQEKNKRTLEVYEQCCKVDHKKPSTIKAYMWTLNNFAKFIEKDLLQANSFDIRAFLSEAMERGCGDKTINTSRVILSSFYCWLEAENFITKSPLRGIKKIRLDSRIPEPFTEVEIEKIRMACYNDRIRTIVEILLSSGVRVSELVNLEISDIDPITLALKVRGGKGGKDRITFISPVAYSYLTKYLDERKYESRYIFQTRVGDAEAPIKKRNVETLLNRLGELAGVEKVHPHKFRRTFATTCAKRGMPIQEIQELLGHSNIETTRRYVTVVKAQLKSSYDKYGG